MKCGRERWPADTEQKKRIKNEIKIKERQPPPTFDKKSAMRSCDLLVLLFCFALNPFSTRVIVKSDMLNYSLLIAQEVRDHSSAGFFM